MQRISTPSTRRLQNGGLCINATGNPKAQGSILDLTARIFGPCVDALGFAKDRYQNSCTAILSLFKRCRPATIVGLVISSIFLTFYGEIRGISIVERPCFEYIKRAPLLADSNAASAVTGVMLVCRPMATGDHSLPNTPQSVPANREATAFDFVGSATLYATKYSPCRTRIEDHQSAAMLARDRDYLSPAANVSTGAGTIGSAAIVSMEEFFHRRTADRAGDHGYQYAATSPRMKWEKST